MASGRCPGPVRAGTSAPARHFDRQAGWRGWVDWAGWAVEVLPGVTVFDGPGEAMTGFTAPFDIR
jgi:hypothetical protein